jgi:hypothetical protein
MAPETGLGVSTRPGGLGETFRTVGLDESMRSGLAHGSRLGDSLRSGLGPGSGRWESILPALGMWAKIITTPTDQGDGGLTASFRERSGLKEIRRGHQVEVSGKMWCGMAGDWIRRGNDIRRQD